MGDGRYYSSSQFFSIVYLTILIIFLVINLMIYLYKGKNRIIITLYTSLAIVALLRFVEAIAMKTSIIELARSLSDILLGLFVILYVYLIHKVSAIVNKKTLITLSLLFVLSSAVLLFDFDTRIVFYILLSINLSIIANYFISYRVTTPIFGDIKDLVLDYVLIVDNNCKVIYKNNNISSSRIFSKSDKIDIKKIESIFSNPSIIRKAYNKTFIKILDQGIYFQYNKKEIRDKDNIAGYIITFTDITDLIHMLDDLELKQKQTKDINIKLALYKEIVYDTEKEREINYLLEKISINQQQSMKNLKVEIENLSENMDSDFDINILGTIKKTKENLLDVRRAVTEYINYYEK